MPASVSSPRKEFVQRTATSSSTLSGIHPTLDRLYRNRGVANSDELNYSLNRLYRPNDLKNLDSAVEIIQEAVRADASILIAGDYDADGATSCALAYLALKAFGARHVAYLCPDRDDFGYGLSEKFVEHLSATEPDLIITVDNGITSIKGVQLAKDLGMTIVVTDHHLPGQTLPIADAIVNPRLPDDAFPSKNLAGVGVIFYVLSVVRSRLAEENWFENEGIAVPNMANYLDLVALGTVADVVPLDYNNRILVAQGLARINANQCRIGIRALLESGKRKIGNIVAEDLAFAAGPRLNAAGRLNDISLGIQCLVSNSQAEVLELIAKLERLNEKRREMESSMVDQAMKAVKSLEFDVESEKSAVCLYNDKWHHGIAGLIAARVREHTSRPTIIFTQDDNGHLRGSGRSVSSVNIRDVIADVANQHPDMIIQFGGHAMAAGLTIPMESFDEFKENFERELSRHQQGSSAFDRIFTDGEVESIDLETAEVIRAGGPWGQGFEAPVFEGEFDVVEFRILREMHLKMRVRSNQHSKTVDAIYFRYFNSNAESPVLSTYKLVYRLESNEFNRRKTPQLVVMYMQKVQGSSAST